ncbi:MAG: family 31 glycosyl hydrolase, alpha-glucosidase [Candidatus Saccharibacteria bacterium]|nr:family 31 glycosyl hydrolase, alpha-glucosidase [Candidatus Saccharibacteria bacterium]
MKRFEDEPIIPISPEIVSLPEGLRAKGETYELLFDTARPYVRMSDKKGNLYAELSLFGGIDAVGAQDEALELPTMTYEQDTNETRIRLSNASTVWDKKDQVWVCRSDSVEVYYEVEGEERIINCTYFAGNFADETMSGRFNSRSLFKSVFNPEPSRSAHRIHSAAQPSAINVTGISRPGMDDWIFTPAPYCFGMNLQPAQQKGKTPDGQWLMMGIAAPVDQQHFTGVHYDGTDRSFSLRVNYEGQTKVDGSFRSPSVLLHFADDPYEGLADYTRYATEQGLLTVVTKQKANFDWWKEPLFCGWGAQCESGGNDRSRPIEDFATQATYDIFMGKLATHNLHPGTITIDDKWQKTYGENLADTDKWPDLAGWIDRRHKVGQKVLLWIKSWDTEGLPVEECVTTRSGKPVTCDPSNPQYLERLRQQVDNMLRADGYNADGFKIDFTARTPSGESLQRHGKEWGTSLLHRYLQTIYDQAKQTKPDSLIVTHTPSPYFGDVTDMIRLNDVHCSQPVNGQMEHRAKVVQAACPELLIDTDNWPMPNIETWRKYLRLQPSLGVMALYFTDSVAGKPMEKHDYDTVRRKWKKWRMQHGLTTFLR